MNLFLWKPSREAGLQRIYTEAYQSSLQSILKESSFEFSESLDLWKQTLAQITAGMALLDGSPPKTGQEKSLLASIMDIERQCHDRISSLELRLQQNTSGSKSGQLMHQSPYGTCISNASSTQLSELSLKEKPTKASRVAVGTKAPRAEIIKSEPSLVNNTNLTSPVSSIKPGSNSSYSTTPATTSPSLDFTDQFVSHMPRVSEMPYDLYTKKPSSVSPPQKLSTRSTPALTSDQISSKRPKEQQMKQSQQLKIQHRSSLDYPQPLPAQYGHSMLTTLRSKNPLKSRNRSNVNHAQHSPSPRSSAENIALTAAKQTVAAATPQKQGSPNLHQFSGFEGSFASDSLPSSPVSDNSQGGLSRQSSTTSYINGLDSSSQASSKSAAQPSLQPAFQPPQTQQQSHNTSTSTRTQFQLAYDQIPTASGKFVYRPRVVRTSAGTPPLSKSGQNHPAPSHTKSSSNQISHRSSQAKLLVDGRPEVLNDPADPEEMDDWDRMVQQKIKDLRGVDKAAAQQILSEVVLKGDQVSWDDIAGLDKAKASLKEAVVYPFLRPDLFLGLREPVLGMLLFGPPGTGKTMLARAVATESKSTFFSISASSLTSKFMGESEKLVRALFQLAKALAPAIIFVDEIDSILTQRADSGEHEASRRIKNEFLVQWSDLQAAAAGKNQDTEAKRVLVLGATNLPWAIDEAARRRFVRRQYIPLPEPFTRRVHLEKLLSHQRHALTEQDLNQLVALTDGYSGSDLTALAKDAAMGPLRSLGDALLTTAPDQIRSMGMGDFVESMKSIRPSVSPEGLRAFEQWAEMYGSSGA